MRSSVLGSLVLGAALASAAAGCGSGKGDAADGRYHLELLRRTPEGPYVSAKNGDALDVIVGFQGYKFARMKARLTGAVPAEFGLDLVLSIDGMPDYPEDLKGIKVPPANPRTSDVFYVYLNHVDMLADIVGKSAHLSFTPQDGLADPVALDVTFTNRPGCIEQYDTTIKCDP